MMMVVEATGEFHGSNLFLFFSSKLSSFELDVERLTCLSNV
ncbi:hypothetical protein Pint_21274 [Pistacia integerrima]|uniref:Uncharacterized protein n=1 Tax=Pistacia integerrima TaxID=434235 RepID=A0ACC0XAB1_9ROSI|nr:hypothetical protein Pint_21274 [Pistacia integerrima]